MINTLLAILLISSLTCVNIGIFLLWGLPVVLITGGVTGVGLTILLDKLL